MQNHTLNPIIFYIQNFYFTGSKPDFISYRYTCMLRNVISSFAVKEFGANKIDFMEIYI